MTNELVKIKRRATTNKIIIHHSLTEDGKTVSWQAIRNYHINTNGWSDIGYHFGIELIDNSLEILVGRPLLSVGAHTVGQNENSIGICCVGNYDIVSPTFKMYAKLAELVANLLIVFKLDINSIYGHRDFAPKSCPGKLFDINELKRLVSEYLSKY